MSNLPPDHPMNTMTPESAKSFMNQLDEISGKNKKTLENKLYIQHINTKQNACNVVKEYFNEIKEFNDILRLQCSTPPVWDYVGNLISYAKFDNWRYDTQSKIIDLDEIVYRLTRIKQIKPK